MAGVVCGGRVYGRLGDLGPVTVVLCNGVFDFFHWGHLVHLQEARTFGNVLIVSVASDAHVHAMKGDGHPYFKLHQRMDMIRALAIVDDVISTDSAEAAIRLIKPHVYVKGIEYQGRLKEQPIVESYGGRVMFTCHDEASLVKSGVVIPKYKNVIQSAEDNK